MVKLRLTRTGRKGHASYRLVAIDSRKARDSRAIEYLGYYLPHDKKIEFNEERVNYWMSVGAQTSDTVLGLLAKQGIISKDKAPQPNFKKEAGEKAKQRAEAKAEKAEAAKEDNKNSKPGEESSAEVEAAEEEKKAE